MNLSHLSLLPINFHWRAFTAHQKVHHLSDNRTKDWQTTGNKPGFIALFNGGVSDWEQVRLAESY